MARRSSARLACMAAAFGLLWNPAYGQRGGAATGTSSTGTATGGGTTATGTTGTPGGTSGTTSGTPSNTTTNTINQPIFLSGRVVMDDGSPLPGPVTIERLCNGTTHSEGYTDTKGNFGIQLGNEQGVLQDAADGVGGARVSGPSGFPSARSSSSNMGMGGGQSSTDRLLQNCELRARLGGYRSQSIMLAGRRAMDDPDVGTILLHRDAAGEGGTISLTSLQAPKDARKAFDKGQEFMKKSKFAEARAEYEKAVQIYQRYAAAWCELGRMQANAGDEEMARGSFRMAVQSDPKFATPYLELAAIALTDKKWQEAEDLSSQAIKLDPFDYPQAYLYNAAAHYNERETDDAEKSVKEAERLDSRHQYPQVEHLYGLILMQKHDYAAAAPHLRDYLRLSPNATDAAVVKTQLQQVDQAMAQK